MEIILNANPKKAPHSIYALMKLWTDCNFRVQTHVHSTIIGSVPDFGIQRDENNSKKNNISIRLIWKDGKLKNYFYNKLLRVYIYKIFSKSIKFVFIVPDLQLKSDLSTCPVTGEVNFLRYLSRRVDYHHYEKSDPVETNLIDSILDLCHILSYQSPKEKQATISRLGDHLTKGPWFLNKKEPSIVDIAVWSLIKQLDSKLPPSLAKWLQNCQKNFL